MLLHELGHGLAALALTEGDVSIRMRGAGLAGGTASYDGAHLRGRRSEVLIAAAGSAVSLVAAGVLWLALLNTDSFSLVITAGALTATMQFVTSALPVRYGAGLGGPADSDGRVIWRVLTGAPPGGLEREMRKLGEPERPVRPIFVVLLVLIGVLALLLDLWLALALGVLFGLAAVSQRRDTGR